jgi:hypothetical protein
MRSLVFLTLLFITLSAPASPVNRCESLFEPHQPIDFMAKMHMIQVGDYRINHFFEEQIGELISLPVRDRRCTYRYTCGWFLPSTLKNIIPPHGAEQEMTSINRREFYDSVYGRYDKHFDHSLVDTLLNISNGLESERTKYAEIRSLRGLLGTYRWFSAKSGWRDVHMRDTMVDLPYVRIGRARGAPDLKVTEFLRRIAAETDIGITEIGNLTNLADTPELQHRTSEMIDMAWLRDARKDDIYVAHVTSLSRARHFKRKYGFEIAETFHVPGNPEPEAILWVRGWQMQEKLSKHLNVEVSDSNDAHIKIVPLLPSEFSHAP